MPNWQVGCGLPDPGTMFGLRIIESDYVVLDGDPVVVPVQVPRTWRERLLTWPWRPHVRSRTEMRLVTPKVPASFVVGNVIYAHPAAVAEMRRLSGRV